MRGNQIVLPTVCVGLVLALAGLSPKTAVAQVISDDYHDRWAKPFFQQNSWDQCKVDSQDMRWDLKLGENKMEMSDAHESMLWHERYFMPYVHLTLWDEGRIEDHMLGWHNHMDIKPIDLSGERHSERWQEMWAKPFCMQPYWDEGRWENHWMNWDKKSDGEPNYRHKETADMGDRPE